MKIITKKLKVETEGTGTLIDLTERLAECLRESGLSRGNLTVFHIGSTAAITTFEFEPGLIKDIQELFDRLIPRTKHYHHDETWGDANGYSHLRAALQGPSLTIPFEDKKLLLGTWQQVVLAEFDNRPRQRKIVVQLIGE
ncbi:MAG TPA: YjbQ family protein [candidate division WOR-3 bacterium]|uniref:YjbQ family protein n=1 Tax=candidate division WOR-3 bacterium TaxID=2052148 RepID=A0A9C9EK87_UNCW3|nr:YjbQ family protein [candidate division WOR-3 bacterium]